MAHVELPDEELKPLLKSIQEAFLPLQKAMPLIMKIPEEISRVADNISQDLSSGVPGKVDGAVEKITKDEAEEQLKKELSDVEAKALERLTKELELLREQGIPAEIKDGEVKRLSKRQFEQSQKDYAQNVTQERLIKEEIETVKKSNVGDKELIEKIKTLNQKLETNNKQREKLEERLAGNLPEQDFIDDEEESVRLPMFDEMKETAMETATAPLFAMTELKRQFKDNIYTPIITLIGINKKHHKKMEDYGKTGEKADKMTILKFMAIAAGIAGILAAGSWIVNKFKGDSEEDKKKKIMESAQQKAYNKAREEGKSKEEALVIAEKVRQDKMLGEGAGESTLANLLHGGLIKDDEMEGRIETAKQTAREREFSESDQFQAMIGSDFTKQGITFNFGQQNNQNNQTNEGPTVKGGLNNNNQPISQSGG